MTAHAEQLRAWTFFRAPLAVPLTAVLNDGRDRRKSFDVVDRGRHAEGPHGRRKRGLHTRLTPTPFQRAHEPSFFAADVGTRTREDRHIDFLPGAQNVVADNP